MTLGSNKKLMTTFGGVRGPDTWVSTSVNAADGVAFDAVIEGAYQTREEIEWLERLLEEVKPRYVLEIGVARGGVSRLFCDAVGPAGHVVGLDISDELVAEDVKRRANYTLVIGDSHDSKIFERVRSFHGLYDLLLIDGDHSIPGVRQDTEWYLPLVKDGGTVLWHDVRLEPNVGIKPYWYGELRRQLPGAAEFYVDAYNNGLGFWRKTPRRMADLMREAEDQFRAGQPDDALKLLAVLADGDPYFPGLWPLWSDAARAAGFQEDAITALARAVILTSVESALNDRIAAIRGAGMSAAILDKAITLMAAPATPENAFCRAELAKELGLLDTAIEETINALEFAPLNLAARRSLLELMTANNRTQQEMIGVVIAAIQAHGQDETGRNAAYDHFADWIERLENRSFFMQRYEEMVDFAILLHRESALFVAPCQRVFKRHMDHPRFGQVRKIIESKVALHPEMKMLLDPS